MNTASYNGIKFSDDDIINMDEWIPAGESNPNNVRPFLLHDHGFVLCVVFADCLQDAIDEAADGECLDRYLIDAGDESDYEDGEGISYLGNDGAAYDISSMEAIELPNPPMSFVTIWNANFGK